jgi:E3 ubiquitin-protein ligase UBR4
VTIKIILYTKIIMLILEGSKDWILSKIWGSGLVLSLVELTSALIPAVESSCEKCSPVGCHSRAQAALSQLHYVQKKFEHTDQLMVNLIEIF